MPDAISLEGGAQDWVQTCGVCHVGGGQLEYDREGNAYSSTSPDGDRFIFDYPTIAFPDGNLTEGFMSATNKAEVDCLLCHLDWTAGATKNNNGLAMLQTWGCDGTNQLGPINDPTCAGDAAPAAPGTSYDMYNRNFALKNRNLEIAPSLGLGATGYKDVATSTPAPALGDLDPATNAGAGIAWGGAPPVIPAGVVAGTPKSANCAPCHARDDATQGLPKMAGMKYGYGNYLVQFNQGDALDTDYNIGVCVDTNGDAVVDTCAGGTNIGLACTSDAQCPDDTNAANQKYWLDFGCKTGMGKRAHKVGIKGDDVGANGVYGAWAMAANPDIGGNPAVVGTVIADKMPDIDVHDRGGMSCATCHYGLGSETVPYSIDQVTGAVTSGDRTFAAGEYHNVFYKSETVKSMDHQFAQPDSYPDVKSKNNLDNTVACESCHDGTPDHPRVVDDGDGTFSLASDPTVDVPQPTHPAFPVFHMDKIACATCHIPETYNAPGRLKYRDWSAGFYKGGFRNMLDFAPNMITGSHDPAPVVRQWLTKDQVRKIYPVLPSVMPIWVEAVANTGTEGGSQTGLVDGTCDVGGTNVCIGGQNAGLACTSNTDCTAVGKGYPTGTCYGGAKKGKYCFDDADCPDSTCSAGIKAPIKARDAGLAARIVRDNHPEFDIRLNGGNMIPLFDGFSMADSFEIDTAAELEAMLTEGFPVNPDNNVVALKYFQANFDVTHGIVPSEWALGGGKRGGCDSCHSSHDPNNANYNPVSVGFFEGHVTPLKAAAPKMKEMGIPTTMAVGGYDPIKNWFGLFADFDCTALCGADSTTPKTDADFFDPATGSFISGATCGDMSPLNAWFPPTATIDHCVGMMTDLMDAAMGFQPGSAMSMGFYDGIAGLQAFTVRESASGELKGCNPMATTADPAMVALYGYVDLNGDTIVDGAEACLQQPEFGGPAVGGMLYSRAEARSHWKVDIQQSYLGGVKRLTWPVGGEKNPSNVNHVNKWDQADWCLDYSGPDLVPMTGDENPFAPNVLPCNGSGPDMIPGNADDHAIISMDGKLHVNLMIPANAYLGYTSASVAGLQQPQSSSYFADLAANYNYYTSPTVSNLVTFDASASKCPPSQVCTLDWDLGDGNVATGATLSHTYAAPGNYTVTLTVTDEHGYSDSETKTVVATDVAPPSGDPTIAAADTGTGGVVDLTVTAGAENLKSIYVIWGDGSSYQYFSAYDLSSKTVSYTYAADGTYDITVYVFDISNNLTIPTTTVTVTSAAP